MAKVLRVAMEIMDICNDKNIEIDYFKLQKLAYICQCVHYAKYQVPLSPEKIYYWTLGGSFKEIYKFFVDTNFIDNTKINSHMVLVTNKIKHNVGDILCFERETINFVIENYALNDINELVELCLNDPLFRKLDKGDIIELHKLKDYYLAEFQIGSSNKSLTLRN